MPKSCGQCGQDFKSFGAVCAACRKAGGSCRSPDEANRPSGSEVGAARGEALQLFCFVDFDIDGQATRDEWVQAFDIIDEDKTGVISRKEWLLKHGSTEIFDLISKKYSVQLSRDEWQNGFSSLDTAGDGKISVVDWVQKCSGGTEPQSRAPFAGTPAAMPKRLRDDEKSQRLAAREYVLLVSGTMNPPHIGHVRLGLAAAERLRSSGHAVQAICYVPVHDNYLCNKVIAKRQAGKELSVLDSIAFPMSERCELLKQLIAGEPQEKTAKCHVLDYEHSSGDPELLAGSPGYWAPKLPGGYLQTVPTASVIKSFAARSDLMRGGARLGVVFGVDNLAGMATWNDPGGLLAQADLVFLARAMAKVEFSKDPSQLLSALKHIEIEEPVPVVYQGVTLLGADRGSEEQKDAPGEGALFMLPPLEGSDEGLSSTFLRNAVAALAADDIGGADALRKDASQSVIMKHGYPESSVDRLLDEVRKGSQEVEQMVASGKARGEWVVP